MPARGRAREPFRAGGHEVERVSNRQAHPGDEHILSHAGHQAQIPMTLDKDFGELAIVRGQPHVDIVPLVNFRAAAQGPACVELLAQYNRELTAGAVVTAEPGRSGSSGMKR